MADKIKIRRGNFINLPDLDSGELGMSVDTGTLYIGTPDRNVLINPVLENGDGYSIDGYLIPATDNVHNLGTPDSRWHSIYVGPGTINLVAKNSDSGYFSDAEFRIGIDADTGTLQFIGNNNTLLMDLDPNGGVTFPNGASLSVDPGIILTIDEHHNQHSDAIRSILKDLDGYATVLDTAASGDGYLAFYTGVGKNLAGDNDLFWDRENQRLGIGTSSPLASLHVAGTSRFDGDVAMTTMQQWISVTLTVDTSAQTGLFNPFNSSSFGGTAVTNTSSGITYSSSTGQFTVQYTGTYEIAVSAFLEHGAIAVLSAFRLNKNSGTIIWSADNLVHSSTDPEAHSFVAKFNLSAGDFVEFEVDSSGASTLIAHNGTTFDMKRIA